MSITPKDDGQKSTGELKKIRSHIFIITAQLFFFIYESERIIVESFFSFEKKKKKIKKLLVSFHMFFPT
jgi:hypothetical protein